MAEKYLSEVLLKSPSSGENNKIPFLEIYKVLFANQKAAALYDIKMLFDLNMDLKGEKKMYSYSIEIC